MAISTFLVIFLIGLSLWLAIRIYYAWLSHKRRIAYREPLLDRVLLTLPLIGMVIVPLMFIFTPFLSFADYFIPVWAGWIGTVFLAAAVILLWRSQADLVHGRRSPVQVVEDRRLVMRGVYRHIRHPVYAAYWLWVIAQPLLLWNWIAGFSMLVTYLPLYLVRIEREEERMVEEFGEDYRIYMQETGRLLPRIWR